MSTCSSNNSNCVAWGRLCHTFGNFGIPIQFYLRAVIDNAAQPFPNIATFVVKLTVYRPSATDEVFTCTHEDDPTALMSYVLLEAQSDGWPAGKYDFDIVLTAAGQELTHTRGIYEVLA